MYAIVEDGGKQYRLQQGDTVFIERRDLPANAERVEFDRVLMIGDGAKSKIGAPYVAGAKVTAKLIDAEALGPKLEIVKFRRRKGYKLHKGHRQGHLKVMVDGISA